MTDLASATNYGTASALEPSRAHAAGQLEQVRWCPPGPDLPSGAVITLREGTTPPVGYTLIGTTVVVIKKPNGSVGSVTVNLYQKN